LQKACREIKGVSNWAEFFDRIGMDRLSEEDISSRLLNAIRNSAKKKYHIPSSTVNLPSGRF
jgi:hypothetical protein